MANANYTNEKLNNLWNDICPGFYNYGRLPPDTDVDTITDLVQANENMIEYIIQFQGITTESRVLELGCGKGMYTVGIAKRTGCSFVGTDIEPGYIEECKEHAVKHGVSDQGVFLVDSMLDIGEKVREGEYTHILVLGAMLYAHGALDKFLNELHSLCNEHTRVFIWDIVRNVDWDKCSDANKHLKLQHPLLTNQNLLEHFQKSGFTVQEHEDATKYIVPSNKFIMRECEKRDPEMKFLTNPMLSRAFVDGTLGYYYYSLGP